MQREEMIARRKHKSLSETRDFAFPAHAQSTQRSFQLSQIHSDRQPTLKKVMHTSKIEKKTERCKELKMREEKICLLGWSKFRETVHLSPLPSDMVSCNLSPQIIQES